MSSIALTSMASSLAPTARPKDPLAKLLPAPLSTYRDFAQNDEIALFSRGLRSPAAVPRHKVEINLTMKAEGGQTVFQTREERDSSELGGSSGGYGFAAKIPLRESRRASMCLRVEAQSRVADRAAVSRETIVNVVAAPAGRPAPTPPAGAPAVPPAAAGAPPAGDRRSRRADASRCVR